MKQKENKSVIAVIVTYNRKALLKESIEVKSPLIYDVSLEYNTPLRNLIRAMVYGTINVSDEYDYEIIRITGGDYAGFYQTEIQSREDFDYPPFSKIIRLLFSGTEDEIVRFDVVRDFAENNVIEFVPVEGADHRFRNERKMEIAMKTILDFYAL